MNGEHDDLRQRIGRLDPAGHAVPVRSHDDPASRQQLEQIMSTTPTDIPRRTNGRRPYLLAAAAAVVVVAAAGTFAALATGDDGGGSDVAAVQLSTPPSDALASCLALDPAFLADMPVAFRGTVSGIEGETVTLTVDRWYKGGDGEAVQITAPDMSNTSIDGLEFVAGETYLVSATDGVVNYCGFSGPATAELQAVYDAAFPG
jgi:hypothetical protein